MKLKDLILKELEQHKGEYISGEELAQHFNVTRTAVWKVIKALENEGYPIIGIRRKGYALSSDSDQLSEVVIQKFLGGQKSDFDITVCKTVDSTNEVLKKLALEGKKEGTVIVAERQSMGKGRKGRNFHSPSDSGIYMSILLRPSFSVMTASLLTSAAVTAVAEAIEAVADVKADIKWVNDILIRGKKICGILTEASLSLENNGLDYVIVGIGINVKDPEDGFPQEIEAVAGSIFGKNTCNGDVRNRLVAEVLKRLIDYYRHLEEKTFWENYKKRLFFLGKEITVISATESKTARALDITENCRLIVRYGDGSVKELDNGEISIKP